MTWDSHIESYLLIHDVDRAVILARQAVLEHPQSLPLRKLELKALADKGDAKELLEAWDNLKRDFPEECYKREVLEIMAVGLLKRGFHSSSLNIKLISLLAMAITELPDAVLMTREALLDSNARIRTLAVEIGGAYGDLVLKEKMVEMLMREPHLEVRKALYKSFREKKWKEGLPYLEKRLERGVGEEEREEILRALVNLYDDVTSERLHTMAKGRVWEREFVTEAILKWKKEEGILNTLMDDPHPIVKKKALHALGLLKKGEKERIIRRCGDPDPEVAAMAAWTLYFLDKKQGEEELLKLSRKNNLYAAAAIGALGHDSAPLAEKAFKTTVDPYMLLNLSYQLVRERVDVNHYGEKLFSLLQHHKEKMMEEEAFFPLFKKSTLTHSPQMPNLPEAANQCARLKILNLLALAEYKGAQEAILLFLKERRWELSSMASEVLLKEGDEEAILLVQNLLSDPDEEIRKQALFAMAIWGKEEVAIHNLMALYDGSERVVQIKILEALGHIGAEGAIPFLVERLKEPSEMMRQIAASSLIKTLYH